MQSLRTSIIWIIGILIGVFGLTVLLGWLRFGTVDLGVVATMGLMFVPVLGVAVGVLIWTGVKDAAIEAALEKEAQPKTTAETRLAPMTEPAAGAQRVQPIEKAPLIQPIHHHS